MSIKKSIINLRETFEEKQINEETEKLYKSLFEESVERSALFTNPKTK